MKVSLVTGATGLLGSHIVKQLILNKENKVIALIHDFKSSLLDSLRGESANLILAHGSILDCERLKVIMNRYEVTEIYHCAAQSIVKQSEIDPIGCFNTNIIGTANVLEAARTIGGQGGGVSGILCMESDKSYGAHEALPYREDSALKPKHIYEVSKAASGMVAMAYFHNFNLPIFSVRAANLFGPGDYNRSRLIPTTIAKLMVNERPILYSTSQHHIREFVYVKDATSNIIQLMSKIERIKGMSINIGSGHIFSASAIIEEITKIMGLNLKPIILEKNSPFKEIEKQYLDISLLKSILPEYQPTEMRSALTETIQWYQENWSTHGSSTLKVKAAA